MTESMLERRLEAIESTQKALLAHLARMEALLESRRDAAAVPPGRYIPLDAAARQLGRTKAATQKLLQRQNDRPDGFHVRRVRGAVHREDFLALIRHLEDKHTGRGERVNNALGG